MTISWSSYPNELKMYLISTKQEKEKILAKPKKVKIIIFSFLECDDIFGQTLLS